jgi:hypothetical protein
MRGRFVMVSGIVALVFAAVCFILVRSMGKEGSWYNKAMVKQSAEHSERVARAQAAGTFIAPGDRVTNIRTSGSGTVVSINGSLVKVALDEARFLGGGSIIWRMKELRKSA